MLYDLPVITQARFLTSAAHTSPPFCLSNEGDPLGERSTSRSHVSPQERGRWAAPCLRRHGARRILALLPSGRTGAEHLWLRHKGRSFRSGKKSRLGGGL